MVDVLQDGRDMEENAKAVLGVPQRVSAATAVVTFPGSLYTPAPPARSLPTPLSNLLESVSPAPTTAMRATHWLSFTQSATSAVIAAPDLDKPANSFLPRRRMLRMLTTRTSLACTVSAAGHIQTQRTLLKTAWSSVLCERIGTTAATLA